MNFLCAIPFLVVAYGAFAAVSSKPQDDDWMRIGIECICHDHGMFPLPVGAYKAEIVGFTDTGRVRIHVYVTPLQKWYKTTVKRKSLSPI